MCLQQFCFDSNTQEKMKKQLNPSEPFFKLSAIALKKSRQGLTTRRRLHVISYVYNALHRLTSRRHMVDGKDDVIKRREIASRISAQ